MGASRPGWVARTDGSITVPNAPRTLEFFFFDAGGGHRAAAIALKEVIAERHPDWRLELINLQELLDPVDIFRRVTGLPSQDFYNAILKRGWTFGSLAMLRTLQRAIRFYTPNFEEVLEKHWQGSRPDLVVSLIPNFNGILFRALRRVHADIPYVTIMTDLADFPPHFWLENQAQFIVCGTDRAAVQASEAGYPAERIFQTSGMILKPLFYRDTPGDRRAGRMELGLDPDLPTALIMFGGYGSKSAERIVDRLGRSGLALQTIVICGHNEKLQESLQGRAGCYAVGFTDRVPDYMRLADFFIGKPGPGSISEALQMGLPVIIERNRMTMPQERPNTEWVEDRQLGIVIKDFRQISEAVQLLLSDGRLERFRQNAACLKNRAVYEIPAILETIVEGAAVR
jgi:UDP-N-acetylglucosamine:LPS N-acetylglucosamine transferase